MRLRSHLPRCWRGLRLRRLRDYVWRVCELRRLHGAVAGNERTPEVPRDATVRRRVRWLMSNIVHRGVHGCRRAEHGCLARLPPVFRLRCLQNDLLRSRLLGTLDTVGMRRREIQLRRWCRRRSRGSRRRRRVGELGATCPPDFGARKDARLAPLLCIRRATRQSAYPYATCSACTASQRGQPMRLAPPDCAAASELSASSSESYHELVRGLPASTRVRQHRPTRFRQLGNALSRRAGGHGEPSGNSSETCP